MLNDDIEACLMFLRDRQGTKLQRHELSFLVSTLSKMRRLLVKEGASPRDALPGDERG